MVQSHRNWKKFEKTRKDSEAQIRASQIDDRKKRGQEKRMVQEVWESDEQNRQKRKLG